MLWIIFSRTWRSRFIFSRCDYGFAQIHPYIFSGIHGNISDTSLRSLIRAVKRDFLGTKQACPFEVQISTTGFLRTSHYQAEWTNSGNMILLRVSYSYFYMRFCKRRNNLLKFSQDSINLEPTISSPFLHFLGQLVQQWVPQMETAQPHLDQSLL